jgi:hypothetical protein
VAHIRYYDAAPQTALEAAARDLIELQAMGFVADHAGKEKILSVSFSFPSHSSIWWFCSWAMSYLLPLQRPKSLYGCGCPLW